jgi:3-phenylpropionate/trans-cinnamate dioxygenase ferredoxin subunit
VDVDGVKIVLVRLGDEVCAITNECPHAGGQLGQGYVQNGAIECPIHLAAFDLRTGGAVRNPAIVAQTYRVTVDGDDVFLVDTPTQPLH